MKFWRVVIYSDFKVEEDAEIDMVRKRYHQLALLLHPDKNKHPKVETAFKLVSEAYACLSDKRKREVYNVERSKLLCKKCQHMVQRTSSVSGEVQLGQSHPKTSRLNVKNWYYKRGSETSDTDDERDESFDCKD